MNNKIQNVVVGFALRINKESKKVNIRKAAFDVAVGTDENNNTTIVLISPKGRSWIRMTTDDDPKISIGSREKIIENISITDWDCLREGKILQLPSKSGNFVKCFSFDLDLLLEIVRANGATLDYTLVDVLKETFIRE